MLRALLLIALAQVAQPAPSQWDDAGRVSPIASLVAWDKGGSQDWGAGIPSPTIDCAATGTSSSASLQCSGATPSFAGTGQTAAGSPWWYRGDAAVRPAIALNGSTDYYTLGDVGDTASDAAGCVEFRPDALTGVTYLFGKTNNSTGPFGIYQSSGSLRVWVVKAGGGYTEVAFGTISVGTWYAACFGYDYVADGSSVLRTTLNGVAGTPSTTAVGPLEDTAHNLAIGAATNGTFKFAGAIRRVALWTGADAPTSAAQLAQMVATQWGLAADKPSGTVATHARTDSTLCCPFSDAECYWLGPGAPCIHAPTYQGWASGGAVAGGIEVYGPGANSIPTSTNVCGGEWLHQNSMACAASGTDAAGSAESFRLTAGATNSRSAGVVGASGTLTHTFSLWVKAGTQGASGSIGLQADGGTAAGCANFTPGASWARVKTTHTQAYSSTLYPRIYAHANCEAGSATVGDNILVSKPQITVTAYPVPYRATTGTGYAGLASTATTVTVPVALTDPARWAIAFTGTPPGAWQLARGAWTLGTYGSANSAALYFTTGQAVIRVQGAGDAYWQFTSPATVGDTHTLLTEYAAGAVTLKDNGAPVSLSFAGAPTGAWTMPATLTVGTVTGQFNGLVSRVAQCRRAGGCR